MFDKPVEGAKNFLSTLFVIWYYAIWKYYIIKNIIYNLYNIRKNKGGNKLATAHWIFDIEMSFIQVEPYLHLSMGYLSVWD